MSEHNADDAPRDTNTPEKDEPRPERAADYNGDVGDQGNDLRFSEEERLIREQSRARPDEEAGTHT